MEIIDKYFPQLSPTQRNQFVRIGELYPEWNAKINVISRKDIDNLFVHHILHSLAIAKFIDFKPSTQIIDVGTGGGFPGIPLAIMFPQCSFMLADRTGKKITVARSIAEEIGLTNVEFFHGDVAEIKQRYDFAVSRAVMETAALVKLIKKNIKSECINALPNGLICLKGGELDAEIGSLKSRAIVDNLSTYFNEDFFETKRIVYIQI
ncbi:MAG: 16S rRNA (guanine(527)-N(7))-methyltransferase RsmG [Candidatus Limisoma sp.]|nr:16S rRNA (guanine(527)-N(7))-methyltransferase RsmG [Bacteroidales bacterium]MDY4942286.1 16S rRNA (guanine(527)-N(7))-methyltransferase RsmG [Candidatus Limisoma sp.]MDD7760093.1 16S rRNA (guanine(527)-N(7))-methyltransferase RsmG [Bacteroidales bacterium]MDY5893998.1 16S rRNA (guanine(527)-N(7))-methyltransferase RsmG [Candidatus Limisoma sp.]MDY6000508.1 16S rRNA (guanine(527)-N(7))-methyltransferase RsmG [Candidatus Limisoma sp.]